MHLRLAGAISEGSGAINEDAFGLVGAENDIRAAWVFDGVTGINDRQYISGTTDAHWLVARGDLHLKDLATGDTPLADILVALVERLIRDFRTQATRVQLPENYDPPAACLVIAKRYREGWKGVRLGDSCALARASLDSDPITSIVPDNALDLQLAKEATLLRERGVTDFKDLLRSFQPKLLATRGMRNQPGGYGILECNRACCDMAEHFDMGSPSQILLCTDGFYRIVDHYHMYTARSLLDRCWDISGLPQVLEELRATEHNDEDCRRFPRLKVSDDATAVSIVL